MHFNMVLILISFSEEYMPFFLVQYSLMWLIYSVVSLKGWLFVKLFSSVYPQRVIAYSCQYDNHINVGSI